MRRCNGLASVTRSTVASRALRDGRSSISQRATQRCVALPSPTGGPVHSLQLVARSDPSPRAVTTGSRGHPHHPPSLPSRCSGSHLHVPGMRPPGVPGFSLKTAAPLRPCRSSRAEGAIPRTPPIRRSPSVVASHAALRATRLAGVPMGRCNGTRRSASPLFCGPPFASRSDPLAHGPMTPHRDAFLGRSASR